MAGTFLGKYDTTAANNTATGTNTVSVAEGMLPSNINNAFRSVMADIRQHYNTAEWIEYGDGAGAYTPAYVSGTSFTIAGVNVTAIYHVGRRVKVVASTPGTIYGSITAVAFSTNTTVTVSWDSGNLSDEAITSVFIGALANTNKSIPIASIATANIADDAVTTAKIANSQITVAKMTTNSVDSDQYVDGSIDTAHIADSQITVGKMAANSVDSDQYVDASIDLAHMSVNSIDSDQYVDASIDAEHLAADIITGAKIADDAIDSEHITDGSIDTAHIAADQITNAKIADDQIDSEHYVDGSIDLAHLSASSVNSSKIVDDSIVNADINSSAAIDATKIANGTVTSAEFQYINTLSSNAQTQIDAKAATTYVDDAVAGLRTRIIAECASTANVTISSALEAGDTIDGITLVAGDRVLLKNQSTASENGLYTAVGSGAGAASRDTQFNSIAELSGQMVVVNQGSANDNKIFLCTTNNTASLGSDSITFTTITPSNSGTVTSITAGTGLSGGAITSAGTIAIDSTVATLAGTQTFTNKTYTSPKINENVAVTSTATELNLLDGVSGLVQADFTKLAAVTSTAVELNLLDGVSGLVQADLTKLAAIDSTATELNKLDALSRGSILYGNASAATTILTKGTANQVLTSDGTDISWSDVSAGISWQSITTGSTLTAVAGRGYPINTTSNACAVTLPGSASVGDSIQIVDYAGTFATNNITLISSLKIEGGTANKILTTNREGVIITYVDATQGWVATSGVNSGDQAIDPIIYSANFLVVAGGGGAEQGGGGAGGFRTSTQNFSAGAVYTITVGDGGPDSTNGSNSSISGSGVTTITSAGGGGGAPSATAGNAGGSGGGAGEDGNGAQGGAGNTPSTSPSQGNNGGNGAPNGGYKAGGGGGGAGAVGANSSGGYAGGDGGNGSASSITGSSVTYAGGGGAGCNIPTGTGDGGDGGTGGGGNGANAEAAHGTAGTVNTGGGGGGSEPEATGDHASGGKGVVILSVPTANYSSSTTGSPTVSTSGGNTIIKFTGSGSYTA